MLHKTEFFHQIPKADHETFYRFINIKIDNLKNIFYLLLGQNILPTLRLARCGTGYEPGHFEQIE